MWHGIDLVMDLGLSSRLNLSGEHNTSSDNMVLVKLKKEEKFSFLFQMKDLKMEYAGETFRS